MLNTLLGIKKGMTSSYDSRGRRVGATIIEVTPNFVTQIKSNDTKDGYEAVQIGATERKNVKKPQMGHFKKAGVEKSLRFVREIRMGSHNPEVDNSLSGLELGQELVASDIFRSGDSVKVTGISKGKGFQGGVRRHGFHGGPKTHGQSDRHRAPGSIGSGTTPGRVLKGKNMAGHMGVDQVSLLGLEVLTVDRQNNLMIVKGGVPGANGSLLRVEKLGKIRGYTAPPEPEVVEEEEEKPVVEAPVEETQEQEENA